MFKIKKTLIVALALMVALSGFPAVAMADELTDTALNNEAVQNEEDFDIGSIVPTSLLPLEEVQLKEIDLEEKDESFKKVKIKDLFVKADEDSKIDLGENDIWYAVYSYRDEIVPYTKATVNTEIDMFKIMDRLYGEATMIFVVGKPGAQLNSAMVRYILKVKPLKYSELRYSIQAYTDAGSERKELKTSKHFSYTDRGKVLSVEAPDDQNADLWIGLKNIIFAEKSLEEFGATLKIYKGEFENYDKLKQVIDAGSAEEIGTELMGADIANVGKGLKYGKLDESNAGIAISLVLTKNGIVREFDSYVLNLEKEKQEVYIKKIDKVSMPSDKTINEFTNRKLNSYASDIPWSFKGDVNAEYKIYLGSRMLNNGDMGVENIEKAVLGYFNSLEQVKARPDIKADLFGSGGYKTKLNNGKRITIFLKNGKTYKIYLKVMENAPSYAEFEYNYLYFEVNGAKDYEAYVLDEGDDSRYLDRDRVFILSDTSADLKNLKMTFIHDDKSTVFAGGESTEVQKSGETVRDFSDKPVQYTVSSADGKNKLDYKVTCVKKHTGGAKLFVSGENYKDESGQIVRECFIDSYRGGYHDVFIANIGDAKLDEISAEIENAKNVKVDEYWKLGGDKNNSLAAFDSVDLTKEHGKLANVGKIRLLNDGEGDISGTLVIKAKDQADVKIKLTGRAGDPKITTKNIPDAVKFVPYQSIVQIEGGSPQIQSAIYFLVTKGELPSGLRIMPNGEIRGIVKKAGSYKFTIGIYNNRSYKDDGLFDEKEFTLNVKDNTDANVESSIDEGHKIETRIPNDVDGTTDLLFKSEGKFADFLDFYIDGNVLEGDDLDYKAESGSTVITIKAATVKRFGEGKHTVAASFKKDKVDSQPLKRTAQNYTWKGYVEPNSGRAGGSSGRSSGRSSIGNGGEGSSVGGTDGSTGGTGTAQPGTIPAHTPSVTPKTVANFVDVMVDSWYAQDVKWAYDKGLMKGIGDGVFSPDSKIKNSTVVTMLTRAAKVDMTAYQSAGNEWYSASEAWAKEKGLLSKEMPTSDIEISRGTLAEMLVKYLKLINVVLPTSAELEGIHFEDEAQMTPEQLESFKVLYKLGIFKGKNASAFMDVNAGTKRAEIAALFHRMEQYIK